MSPGLGDLFLATGDWGVGVAVYGVLAPALSPLAWAMQRGILGEIGGEIRLMPTAVFSPLIVVGLALWAAGSVALVIAVVSIFGERR